MTTSDYVLIVVAVLPFALNALSSWLTESGRPKAARIVDALTPVAVASIQRATKMPPDKPKDGPTLPPGTGGAIMVGLAIGFAIVALTGCADLLAPPVVAVNTSEEVLTQINTSLAEIEGRQLEAAIDAAPDAIAAHHAKDEIAAKYHKLWEAYDKARAAWVLAKIATAEALAIEATGGKPNMATVLTAATDLAKQYAALQAAVKELAK